MGRHRRRRRRTRARVRAQRRARRGGQLPPGAAHLTRANASLRTLRSLIASALQRFEQARPIRRRWKRSSSRAA